jgi:RNA polymerase sigma-70 factor (ECF subfamily)
MEEDRLLVQRLLAGDESALRMFFDEYFDRLYRFAYARLRGDAALAEDAAQNTLARALRGLPGFRGEAGLFSWLAQICRNEIADLSKVRAHQCAHGELVRRRQRDAAPRWRLGSRRGPCWRARTE